MKCYPIIFSTGLVPAILSGEKTQTRRIRANWRAGDQLWVREAWQFSPSPSDEGTTILYRADRCNDYVPGMKWRPSIFMPRWASRIALEVLRVWEEALHDISRGDATAEGCRDIESFRALWDYLNEKSGFGWDRNPRVIVTEFRVLEPGGET